MSEIDHGVRHQLHTVMALLYELEAQQEPLEFGAPLRIMISDRRAPATFAEPGRTE
jgi:hypothetical protein